MGIPRVMLGRTGIEVSQLALGTGTDGLSGSSRQTRLLGVTGLADLLVYAHERGVTFIDAADAYGSHPHVREALKRLPREKVVVTTKTVSGTADKMESDLDRFRRELDTDYLDIVLLHCMTDNQWNVSMRPAMEVLNKAKEKAIVRAVGCSNHSFGALRTAAEEPWVDVVLVRINPRGIEMDDEPEKVVPVIRYLQGEGKGTYGMKVMGQGKLGGDARSAIRYQLSVPVDAFVIGMENRRQVDENVRLVSELTSDSG